MARDGRGEEREELISSSADCDSRTRHLAMVGARPAEII